MFSSINISFNLKRAYDANALLGGEINNLVEKIKSYHKQKPLRAFRDYKESAFQMAVELLLPQKLFISEMRLIVDYISNSYKNGFADIFLSDNNYGYSATPVLKSEAQASLSSSKTRPLHCFLLDCKCFFFLYNFLNIQGITLLSFIL